jgi:hypothetical protein
MIVVQQLYLYTEILKIEIPASELISEMINQISYCDDKMLRNKLQYTRLLYLYHAYIK